MSETTATSPTDLDLTHGGPLYRLLRRTGLASADAERIVRRILVVVLLCWVPIVVLCALDGTLWAGRVQIPFLQDVFANVRILLVVPLLLAAEPMAQSLWTSSVERLAAERIVPPEALPRLQGIVAWARSWRDRTGPEVAALLVALAFVVGLHLGHVPTNLVRSSWAGRASTGGALVLTPAGVWYGYVAVLLLGYLLIRWLERIVLWYVVLARIAGLGLALKPHHPDRMGGIGFLAFTVLGYAPLAVAFSASISARAMNQMLHAGAQLSDFYVPAAASALVFLLAFVLPFVAILAPRLKAARRDALAEYAALSAEYGRRFADRWRPGASSGPPPADEGRAGADLPGLDEIQSGVEQIQHLTTMPIPRWVLMQLGIALAAPALGPILLRIPVEEILHRALKMFSPL